MKKYVCDTCGWEYDPEQGYPEGVAAIGDTRKEDVESMEAFNLLLERVDNGR